MWPGRLSRSGFCSRAGERERRAGGVRSRHPGNAPAESPQAVARYTRRRKQASNAWYPVANG